MYTTRFLDLPPLMRAGGTLRLPGSKSISNRVLLLAGLAAGTTVVHDLLDSDDTRVMLAALRELGCSIDEHGATLRITVDHGEKILMELVRILNETGASLSSVNLARPTLDDVFLTVTGRSLREDAAPAA